MKSVSFQLLHFSGWLFQQRKAKGKSRDKREGRVAKTSLSVTNQRPVLRSRDLYWPISGRYVAGFIPWLLAGTTKGKFNNIYFCSIFSCWGDLGVRTKTDFNWKRQLWRKRLVFPFSFGRHDVSILVANMRSVLTNQSPEVTQYPIHISQTRNTLILVTSLCLMSHTHSTLEDHS